jgi:hypothetical protein
MKPDIERKFFFFFVVRTDKNLESKLFIFNI